MPIILYVRAFCRCHFGAVDAARHLTRALRNAKRYVELAIDYSPHLFLEIKEWRLRNTRHR